MVFDPIRDGVTSLDFFGVYSVDSQNNGTAGGAFHSEVIGCMAIYTNLHVLSRIVCNCGWTNTIDTHICVNNMNMLTKMN